jgi:NADPH-dependent 2,4-dienoyl-CoA reductase/sulfur reductase-like enzyme/rhodanese-related sulfurtransferase
MKKNKRKSDFVIIGGVAAGPKTASVLARRLPSATITLYELGNRISYGSCGLPYFAAGVINSIDELSMTSYGVKRDADFFKKTKGFEVITGAEIVRVNHNQKSVAVKILETGETYNHEYDKLVLATGSVPVTPSFPFPDSPRIRYFTRPQDATDFREDAQTGKIGKAAIIGAGFIGCELAEAVGDLWGIEVTLIEKEGQILPKILDPEIGSLVEDELREKGVEVLTDTEITGIELDQDDNPVIFLNDGSKIDTDFVFLCLGVKPDTSLAKDCGLEIGHTGGIVVNGSMQTSDPHIYAGGDCVESVNRITWERAHMPMGSLANRHGRIIAENLSGGKSEFPGVLGTMLLKVFDTNIGAVGITMKTAKKAGINAAAVWGTFGDKPDFYPESKTITLKMIFDNEDGRLLGLQAVGEGDICRRVDLFSMLLHQKAHIDDILDHEHGYAPPYSEALDPLYHLSCMAKAALKGVQFLDPGTDILNIGENVTLLDVREPEEVEAEPFNGVEVTNIPLNDLRERLSELDKNRKIILICKRGPRSYQAALILIHEGFEDLNILGGGVSAVPKYRQSLAGAIK